MYSERQKELKVFLQQLQQSVEGRTGEKVEVHSATKADGKKFLEIVIGENPLFSPVVWVEESSAGYERNSLEDILQRIWAVYGRYKELERRNFPLDKVKGNVYLRLIPYERNKDFLRDLSEEICSDCLFILPVSVYEVFVIPEDNVLDAAELQELIKIKIYGK